LIGYNILLLLSHSVGEQVRQKAPRGGKCFVVPADEKLTAFLELESAIRACNKFA
jgi:hypothetical protein